MLFAFFGAIRCGDLTVACDGITFLVIQITDHIFSFPFPVTKRKHSADLNPCGRAGFDFQFYTHVLCTYTGHIDERFLALTDIRGGVHRLVDPACVVAVERDVHVLVVETVTNLSRGNLFVARIAVERMRGVGIGVCGLELRCTADITDVDEHVVVLRDVVVGSSLDRSAYEPGYIRFAVLCIVVHTVLTPVVAITDRGVHEGRQTVLRIFQGSEQTFLHHMSCVVAIDNVAYVQFLVLPKRIQRVLVVLRINTETGRVDEVIAGQEIRNHRTVDTLVVTKVKTCCQFQDTV